jgi:PadR family transcriptional regulator, regulatory protein PadR
MSDQISREILSAFWKIHILHHAAEQPIYGQWLLEELRRHGLIVSPGTLYLLLSRMEQQGWLRPLCNDAPRAATARRRLELTAKCGRVLTRSRRQVDELHREVVREASHKRK